MDQLRQRIRQRILCLTGRSPAVGLAGFFDKAAQKAGYDSYKDMVKTKQQEKDDKLTYSSPVFPEGKYYHAQSKPEGADEAVDKLIKTGFPQIVAILQSGADAIGFGPEQISIFRDYERPAAPGPLESGYAAKLSRQYGVVLGGDDADMTREAFKQSLEEGMKDAAKDLAVDIVTQIIPALPATPAAGIIKAGIDFVENKDLLKTSEGRQQALVGAGFTIASFVPVLNVAAFVGQAVMAVASLNKAKDHARAEAQRAKAFGRMVQGMTDFAVTEAGELATALAERGVHIRSVPDQAWSDRLLAHYKQLETLADRDVYETKPEADGLFSKIKQSFEEQEASSLGRTEKLTFFLQIARDMRRVREALERRIDLRGSEWKDAARVAAEINELTYQMLLKDPGMPFQQAVNLAAATARQMPGSVSPQAEEIATKTVEKVAEIKSQQNLVAAGALGLVGLALAFWR